MKTPIGGPYETAASFLPSADEAMLFQNEFGTALEIHVAPELVEV